MEHTPTVTADSAYRVSLSTAPWEAFVATLEDAASLLGRAAESRAVSRVLRINGAFAGLGTLDHAEVEALTSAIGR